MKKSTLLALSLSILSSSAIAASGIVYKSASCGCCEEWVNHMKDNGFDLKVENIDNLHPIKKKLGITPRLASCHTAVIDDYIFEGHIPASDIHSFLASKPNNVDGLAVPGMPLGSPGMEYGNKKQKYRVMSFSKDGKTEVFNEHE
ncbi:copper amine oxidase [Veronia nyctiphanis]|uniref:Copper amine oxidase n=1 Tax=Veronia nyctiphanis TaxID=1278244 RepID=A0A4Q0YRR4_9GAMM|nr:DUF411 domain-containing protein [Veronia nyctiphanis]RXJ73877.1 copper amine oxidase [Veronia nyctiphanis]